MDSAEREEEEEIDGSILYALQLDDGTPGNDAAAERNADAEQDPMEEEEEGTIFKSPPTGAVGNPGATRVDSTVEALFQAIALGQLHNAQELIHENSIDVNLANLDGELVVFHAIKHEQLGVLHWLMQDHVNLIEKKDREGRTPFLYACFEGKTAFMSTLADRYGANVKTTAKDGETALILAAKGGHCDAISSLCDKYKANVHVGEADGWTPLMHACSQGHVDAVRLLCGRYKAQVETCLADGETALLIAISYGQEKVVDVLCQQYHASVNVEDDRGQTPFLRACAYGNSRLAQVLCCEYGASTSASNGGTGLSYACYFGYLDVARMLLENKAFTTDVDAQDVYGDTALMDAASEGHFAIVRMLCEEFGADIDTSNRRGRTALHKAAFKGHVEVVEYLVDARGADVTAADLAGASTSVYAACSAANAGSKVAEMCRDKYGVKWDRLTELCLAVNKEEETEETEPAVSRDDKPEILKTIEELVRASKLNDLLVVENVCEQSSTFTLKEAMKVVLAFEKALDFKFHSCNGHNSCATEMKALVDKYCDLIKAVFYDRIVPKFSDANSTRQHLMLYFRVIAHSYHQLASLCMESGHALFQEAADKAEAAYSLGSVIAGKMKPSIFMEDELAIGMTLMLQRAEFYEHIRHDYYLADRILRDEDCIDSFCALIEDQDVMSDAELAAFSTLRAFWHGLLVRCRIGTARKQLDLGRNDRAFTILNSQSCIDDLEEYCKRSERIKDGRKESQKYVDLYSSLYLVVLMNFISGLISDEQV